MMFVPYEYDTLSFCLRDLTSLSLSNYIVVFFDHLKYVKRYAKNIVVLNVVIHNFFG